MPAAPALNDPSVSSRPSRCPNIADSKTDLKDPPTILESVKQGQTLQKEERREGTVFAWSAPASRSIRFFRNSDGVRTPSPSCLRSPSIQAAANETTAPVSTAARPNATDEKSNMNSL